MNQQLKQKWIRALRSGEYHQGEGQLRKHSEYCCLGVLCDIHPGVEWREEGDDGIYAAVHQTDEPVGYVAWDVLPKTLAWELGVQGYTVRIDREDEESVSLATLNDSGCTFDEIADIIEEHL